MGTLKTAGLMLTALLFAVASAAQGRPVSPGDRVPGHGAVIYLDLLRAVAPDLTVDDATDKVTGHLRGTLRHLAGPPEGGPPPDPLEVSAIEAVSIKAGGRDRIVLMADLGPSEDRVESTTLLALFDDAPTPRLLDFADVGLDRDTGFLANWRIRLSPRDDALVTYSEHSNSSQTYAGRLIVFVRNGKLTKLAQLFALSEQACGWRRLQNPVFAVRPDPGGPYGQLTVTMRVVTTVEPAECDERPPRPTVRTYSATYRWNARRGRFTTTSRALQRLDRINRANF